MCNTIRGMTRDLKGRSGKGYKIFSEYMNQMVYSGYPYHTKEDGWVEWDQEKARFPEEIGFCVIPTIKEAKRLLRNWKWSSTDECKIYRVEYKGGICRKEERYMQEGKIYTILLVKKFKALEEVENG